MEGTSTETRHVLMTGTFKEGKIEHLLMPVPVHLTDDEVDETDDKDDETDEGNGKLVIDWDDVSDDPSTSKSLETPGKDSPNSTQELSNNGEHQPNEQLESGPNHEVRGIQTDAHQSVPAPAPVPAALGETYNADNRPSKSLRSVPNKELIDRKVEPLPTGNQNKMEFEHSRAAVVRTVIQGKRPHKLSTSKNPDSGAKKTKNQAALGAPLVAETSEQDNLKNVKVPYSYDQLIEIYKGIKAAGTSKPTSVLNKMEEEFCKSKKAVEVNSQNPENLNVIAEPQVATEENEKFWPVEAKGAVQQEIRNLKNRSLRAFKSRKPQETNTSEQVFDEFNDFLGWLEEYLGIGKEYPEIISFDEWETHQTLALLKFMRKSTAVNYTAKELEHVVTGKSGSQTKKLIQQIGFAMACYRANNSLYLSKSKTTKYNIPVIAWLHYKSNKKPLNFDIATGDFLEKTPNTSSASVSTTCSEKNSTSDVASIFQKIETSRRLLASTYRLVDPNEFPQYGTFNHRVEHTALGEELWCCDHFPDVKLSQPELPCTAQPTHVTTRHSSSVGDAKHWGGDWTLYAAAAVIGAAALLFLKKAFWGTGAKKNANSARNTYLRGQSGNRAHVVPRDAKTNSLDPTFAQYRKNK
eukprot:GHVT01101723.1.p1 GENE.GHVT01101723.1~~GHVT01101723.1.p1  ORF type:complete len:635 (-),score=67.47 GHVT01101723.1:313-2217(-)